MTDQRLDHPVRDLLQISIFSIFSVYLGYWLRSLSLADTQSIERGRTFVLAVSALLPFLLAQIYFNLRQASKPGRWWLPGLGAVSVSIAFLLATLVRGVFNLGNIPRLAWLFSGGLVILFTLVLRSVLLSFSRIFKMDWVDRFYRFISTSHFPLVYDVPAETRKLNVARLLVGLIALIRTVLILGASFFYFPRFNVMDFWITAPQEAWAAVIMCGLWLLFTVGLLTPLASFALLIFYNQFDFLLGTTTLGTNVLTLMMLYFLLVNAGQVYSLDAALLSGRGPAWLQTIARSVYSLLGNPDRRHHTIYKFILFASYALVSLGAIQFHLRDTYWLSGQTISVLLTSSYLNRFYEAFRWSQTVAPQLLSFFSVFSVVFQTVYQLAMIPLMWLKPGKYFVVVWGLGFFLISAIGLQLSYLPFFELILWGICFAQLSPAKHVTVLYDDYCNLCKRTVQFLNAINFIQAFDFRPLSKNLKLLEEHSLSRETVERNIHAIKDGRLYVGYDFYKVITHVHPLLFPFYPLLELGALTRIGPRIYKYIADRRKELFGVCEVSFDVNKRVERKPRLAAQRQAVSNFYIGFTLLSWFFYVSTFSVLTPVRSYIPPIPSSMNYLYEVGLVTPNVFNSVDLAMGDQWYIINEDLGDGNQRRLLLNGFDGEEGNPSLE